MIWRRLPRCRPELSIADNRRLSRVPLQVCGSIQEDVSLPDTEFRHFSIENQSNTSWHAEIDRLAAVMRGEPDEREAATDR